MSDTYQAVPPAGAVGEKADAMTQSMTTISEDHEPTECRFCATPFGPLDTPDLCDECVSCRWLGCEMTVVRHAMVEGQDYWLTQEYAEGFAYSSDMLWTLALDVG